MELIVFTNPAPEHGWLEINALEAVDAVTIYLRENRSSTELEALSSQFKGLVKKMNSRSLIDFLHKLMFASGKNLDDGVRILWFVNVIIEELTRRCMFFEKSHPVPAQ